MHDAHTGTQLHTFIASSCLSTHAHSYTVVTCSFCRRYLLVATDSPILLVLRLADWGVVRRLYGLDVDKFHNASVAWHKSSSYIMAGVYTGSCGCVGCAVAVTVSENASWPWPGAVQYGVVLGGVLVGVVLAQFETASWPQGSALLAGPAMFLSAGRRTAGGLDRRARCCADALLLLLLLLQVLRMRRCTCIMWGPPRWLRSCGATPSTCVPCTTMK